MPYVIANPIAPRPTRPMRRLRGMRGMGFYGLGQNNDGTFDMTPPAAPGEGPFSSAMPAPLVLDTSLPLPPVAAPPPPPTIDAMTGQPLNPSAPPPPSVAVSSAPAPSASSSSALQPGTLLSYTCQVGVGGVGNLLTGNSIAASMARVAQALQQNWGIDVVNTQLPSLSIDLPGSSHTVTLVVQLQNAYGQASDVKANIDHEVINALGASNLFSSSIKTCGNTISGCAASGPSSSWISQNWPWLVGAGAAALLVLKVME